jgi:hypothetical protein
MDKRKIPLIIGAVVVLLFVALYINNSKSKKPKKPIGIETVSIPPIEFPKPNIQKVKIYPVLFISFIN